MSAYGKYLRWSFSPLYGQALVRIRARQYILKAPWCRPLPSEWLGFNRVHQLGFGWRFMIREIGNKP